MKDYIDEHIPEAVCYIPEATYLAWVDMGKVLPGRGFVRFFANRAGVLLEGGTICLSATPKAISASIWRCRAQLSLKVSVAWRKR